MAKLKRIEMDEETLILTVEPFKELYDMSHPKYANNDWKDNCWKDISKAMKKSVVDCKAVWRRLREGYRKARLRQNTKSGAAATKKRVWKFELQMAFLAPHISERETQSNIDDPDDTFGSASTSQEDDNAHSDENGENVEGDDVDVTNESGSSPVAERTTGTTSIFGGRPNPKKSASQIKNQLSEVASALIKYLNDKPKKPVEDKDNLTKFFINMAQTVKTFSPSTQVEVKSKVFTLINEYEMQGVSKSQPIEGTSRVSHTQREWYPVEDIYRNERMNSHYRNEEQNPNANHRYDYQYDNSYGGSGDDLSRPISNPKRSHPDQPNPDPTHSSNYTMISM